MEKTQPQIIIYPELPIGTEIYFMNNNKITLALVSEYTVSVTAYTDKNEGWFNQIYIRWMNGKKQKDFWEYKFNYWVLCDDQQRNRVNIYKKNDQWYISNIKCYLSEDDLKKDL